MQNAQRSMYEEKKKGNKMRDAKILLPLSNELIENQVIAKETKKRLNKNLYRIV